VISREAKYWGTTVNPSPPGHGDDGRRFPVLDLHDGLDTRTRTRWGVGWQERGSARLALAGVYRSAIGLS
jgi:hypothetical protein